MWEHRRFLVNYHPTPPIDQELQIIDFVLTKDNRNYLVWGYRVDLLELAIALLEKSGKDTKQKYMEELKWVEAQIKIDIRNNSAWHYRQVLVRDIKLSYQKDFDFIREKAFNRPGNEAVWNYLEGLENIHIGKDKGFYILF